MPALPESRLARRVSSLREAPLDVPTRERLAQALLDWFTAGWSAAPMPLAGCFRTLAADCYPGTGETPVFGGAMLPLPAAAFANAAIAHIREIDDAHRAAMLHPGVVAVSPVMAFASGGQLTRRRMVDAILAGYEVALRVGEALGTRHAANFHATATAGTLGAAAASSMALGLPEAVLHHALGLGATQAQGLWQLMEDDAQESKSLHPAFAVRNGMTAALAARAGLPGARSFVTGKRALYANLAGDGPLDALDAGLDGPLRLHTATIKAWPCCAQLFTPLDAAQELLAAHRPDIGAIREIEVAIFPHALKIAGVDWPARPAETCFSLRYVLAVLLLRGRLTIEDMEAPRLDDPALRDLADRIRIRTDEAFQREFPHRRPSTVTLVMADGNRLYARRDLRRGDPEDPFDWNQMLARMRAFAPAMSDEAASSIAAWCEAFVDPACDGEPALPPPCLFGTAELRAGVAA
ncbi:MmgE/PrpD family protein [Pigmentiphaga daeguensis]|uniref:2-methylcitrate dehydratase PrpD n=1 Tax=Pigmentiphaga daeguensis TaxID=414049 RepID=A0ABN1CAI7_9BURK